jgi:hypothetical protein
MRKSCEHSTRSLELITARISTASQCHSQMGIDVYIQGYCNIYIYSHSEVSFVVLQVYCAVRQQHETIRVIGGKIDLFTRV